MNKEDVLKRIDRVISRGNFCIENKIKGRDVDYAPEDLFYTFKALTFEIIEQLKGKESSYYKQLTDGFRHSWIPQINVALNLLNHLREDVELGYIDSIESLIVGEVYTNFLDIAEYFITQEFYDAAAVMAGGVLEGHLKKMSAINNISLTTEKDGRIVSKGANWLNDDLRRASVYDKKEFNSVNVMLEIRNDAAHTDKPIVERTRAQQLIATTKLFITRHTI